MELQLAIKDLNASQLRNTHEAGMFAANCDQSKQGMLSAALQVHGNRSRKVVIVGSFAYVLGRAQNNELRKSQDEARKPNRVLEDSHPLTHGCFVPNESQLFLPGGETKSKERSGRANVKSFDFNNYKRGGGCDTAAAGGCCDFSKLEETSALAVKWLGADSQPNYNPSCQLLWKET